MRMHTTGGLRPIVHLFIILIVGAPLLATTGCAPKNFQTAAHRDVNYDFASVKTFAFDPKREKVAASQNGKYVAQALRDVLVERGYQEVDKSKADVLFSYDIGVYAPTKVSGQSTMAKFEGSITIWIYDRKTGANVWYGWAERPVSPHDEAESAIRDAVDTIVREHMRPAE